MAILALVVRMFHIIEWYIVCFVELGMFIWPRHVSVLVVIPNLTLLLGGVKSIKIYQLHFFPPHLVQVKCCVCSLDLFPSSIIALVPNASEFYKYCYLQLLFLSSLCGFWISRHLCLSWGKNWNCDLLSLSPFSLLCFNVHIFYFGASIWMIWM